VCTGTAPVGYEHSQGTFGQTRWSTVPYRYGRPAGLTRRSDWSTHQVKVDPLVAIGQYVPVVAAVLGVVPVARGLHSSTFQLNLSRL
jgi:hypothetical protein